MAYIEAKAPGFRYGLGTLSEAGEAGLCVALSGDNEFELNGDSTKRSFGILVGACVEDALCGVWCGGGIYETDQFTGSTIAAGDELACDSSTSKLKKAGEGDFVIGHALANVSGVLRFKLLV